MERHSRNTLILLLIITSIKVTVLCAGHRPRRTVVFCSWDAEEYGLMGSVEWVEVKHVIFCYG